MKKITLLFILISRFVFAQEVPEQPSNYVTDVANILTVEQQNSLNKKLKTFEDSTSNQIFVLVANSLNGEVLEDFTQNLFVKWKVGQKNKNNGVLITIFVTDRKFRIHTGYGLEGVLPDVLTKQIQDETMVPFFKQGNYYGGINAGIDKLIKSSKGEFKVNVKPNTIADNLIFYMVLYGGNIIFFVLLLVKDISKNESTGLKVFFIFVAIFFLIIPFYGCAVLAIWFLINRLIKAFNKRGTGTNFWTGALGSTYSSSGYSDNSSSSSWSSSSSDDSSSSFDGGGGGDSGGGGSSSSW